MHLLMNLCNGLPMRTEAGALVLSAGMSLLLGTTGLILSVVTGSQVILLDGLFNLIYSVMAFLSVRHPKRTPAGAGCGRSGAGGMGRARFFAPHGAAGGRSERPWPARI